ncbi:MAG: 1-acyl-sn-glycerol-3-phosphate acyltransferase [Gammaproteobacteria bacterium]|nr:1-acyl-sn-glycerol-3-phosphate acyltransferase [Gammaproteobacteria bacterium]
MPVPEFQYTRRREIIYRLLDDKLLQQRINQQACATGQSTRTLRRRCRRYAREIVPAFSALFYFRIGNWLARTLLLSLYRVHARTLDIDGLDAIKPGSSVVLMINHRSSIDPLLVTYLASRRSTLLTAAGEWARMWPLYHFVHLAGNPIADRDAQDVLYKHIFKAFIQMAAREGTNMAIFPEGQLPRDGKMQAPKLGLFNYAVTADPRQAGKLYLIPVAINYDRVPEEDQLLANPDATYRRQGAARRFASAISATLVFLTRFLLPRQAQLGNACASFGQPFSLSEWQSRKDTDAAKSDDPRAWVSALGNEMFQQVARIIPVMPSHTLAALLLSESQSTWSVQTISRKGMQLMHAVRDRGGVTCFPDAECDHAFTNAVDEFLRRDLLSIDADGLVTPNPDKVPTLRFMANSVSHLLEGV